MCDTVEEMFMATNYLWLNMKRSDASIAAVKDGAETIGDTKPRQYASQSTDIARANRRSVAIRSCSSVDVSIY